MYLSHFILLLCLYRFHHTAYGIPISGKQQSYRDVTLWNHYDQLSEKDTGIPCIALLDKCKRSDVCKKAVRRLETKCPSKAGSCNAEMRDLQECAWIMDALKHNFNKDRLCSCSGDQKRCSVIYSTVYENPCFSSVELLRKMNLMPKLAPSSSFAKAESENDVTGSDDVIEKLLRTLSNESINKHFNKTTMNTSIMFNQEADHIEVRHRPLSDVTTELAFIYNSSSKNYIQSTAANDHGVLQEFDDDDPSLLYAAAIAAGLSILVLLAIGCGLGLYFRLLKKEKEEDTRTPKHEQRAA